VKKPKKSKTAAPKQTIDRTALKSVAGGAKKKATKKTSGSID